MLASGPNGITATVRAFLDMGSQMSCATESLVQYLGLRRKALIGGCTGIGQTPVNLNGIASLAIASWNKAHTFCIKVAIIKRITCDLPTRAVTQTNWHGLANDELADPNFGTPGPVSILLGADVIGTLLNGNLIGGNGNAPHAMATKLGWILFGPIGGTKTMGITPRPIAATVLTGDGRPSRLLEEAIKRLWELQEPPQATILTAEEAECETMFATTHQRDANGKYIVRIPFKQDPSVLGESRNIAMYHFYRLERRLARQPDIWKKYVEFMECYEAMGHMKPAPSPPTNMARLCYIVHLAVLGKFRVVFHASLATNNGIAINDIQMAGPTLQPKLWQLLMRFRRFKVAVSADVEKMFRMVWVNECDWDLQRIFWRAKPTDVLKEYQLLTVTYGMKSASYNAVKALIQCGLDQASEYPRAAKAIADSFYMDDFLACYDTAEEAIDMSKEVDTVLKKGGFTLRKWRSSDWNVLSECHDVEHGEMKLEEEENSSVLGLKWNVRFDSFNFIVSPFSHTGNKYTKRIMASEIARVFDPTGFLSPVTIVGKILIQRLWLTKCDWDEAVPPQIQLEWTRHCEQLHHLNNIKVPRWIGIRTGQAFEFHYFCDASQLAYAAVCYVRTIGQDGKYMVRLLTSKAKVAPLKTISVPRLELCAAAMAAELHAEVQDTLQIAIEKATFWSDSKVVLAWLESVPRTMQTYVANRVSRILSHTEVKQWNHIAGTQNPADCASRGVSPDELPSHDLWWHGPSIIQQPAEKTEATALELDEEEKWAYGAETKHSQLIAVNIHDSPPVSPLEISGESLLYRTNSLYKLLRITTYVFRFVGILQRLRDGRLKADLRHSLAYWITQSQQEAFFVELSYGQCNRPLPRSSPLRDYGVLIDADGILRMRGRLENAPLSYDARHPIIIPAKSQLAKLLILDAHRITLHGGTQVVLNHLRQRYWIVHARNFIKQLRYRCVTCKRNKPTLLTQQMADLPAARVNPNPPFTICGVDYFGPVMLRVGHVRSKTRQKGYVAVFVCMVTRAIHLECAEDLSTEKFIEALQRLMARRGVCKEIWSDNATNFHGANNCWLEAIRSSAVPGYLATVETAWHFITPHSPWQGGIWESAVRSTKHHLKRVLANATLSIFEMHHVLTRIEGVLNSRPLAIIHDDKENDALVLTPGHFLIGRPLLAPPDTLDHLKGLKTRYEQRQRIVKDFWQSWSREYLLDLQRRIKWQDEKTNVKIGDVVVLQNENMPPANWLLGRIVELHPGPDKLVRNVSVRTPAGIVKRSIQRLCLLPVEY